MFRKRIKLKFIAGPIRCQPGVVHFSNMFYVLLLWFKIGSVHLSNLHENQCLFDTFSRIYIKALGFYYVLAGWVRKCVDGG